MGRTVPSFTPVIDKEIASWKRFSISLHKEDREIFEEMMIAARKYRPQGMMAARAIPSEALFMSIMFEMYAKLHRLEHGQDPANQDHQEILPDA